MREMYKQGALGGVAAAPKPSPSERSRSRKSPDSSSSSSSSGNRRKKKKKHKKHKGRRRGGGVTSSVRSLKEDPDKTSGQETNPEIETAKAQALEKLMKLKEIESKENRSKEFRALLRKWHPDKNPEQQEVATAVFQFLQKGKLLIES
eukprot:g19802.t1